MVSTGLCYLFFLYVLRLLKTVHGAIGIPEGMLAVVIMFLSLASSTGIYFVSHLILKKIKKVRADNIIALSVAFFFSFLYLVCGLLWIKSSPLALPKILIAGMNVLVIVSTISLATIVYHLSMKKHQRSTKKNLKVHLLTLVFISLLILIATNTLRPKDKAPAAGLESAPNILLIVIDTAARNHFSCYGYERSTTPHIDAFAQEGILFENAIIPTSWTLPGHASIFTGLFVTEHYTNMVNEWLASDFTTIAEVLDKYGYLTFGYSNNTWVSRKYNTTQGFRFFHEYIDIILRDTLRKYLLISDYGARHTNTVVKRWIKNSLKREKPFFIFINYMEAHSPYGDTPYRKKFRKNLTRQELDEVNELGKIVAHNGTITEKQRKMLIDLYDADLLYLDKRIGELLTYLRKINTLDDTIVIITADHGEHLGDHDLVGHGNSLYDVLIRIPLIIRYPKAFNDPGKISEQFCLTELFPLLTSLLGIEEAWETVPGKNMKLREFLDNHDATFAEMWKPTMKALRINDGAKYIINKTRGEELFFDLDSDSGEENNLNRNLPSQARKLVGEFEELLENLSDTEDEEVPEGGAK